MAGHDELAASRVENARLTELLEAVTVIPNSAPAFPGARIALINRLICPSGRTQLHG